MSLLGMLAAMEQFVKLGRLHMRLLQYFLRVSRDRKIDQNACVFPTTKEIKEDLR